VRLEELATNGVTIFYETFVVACQVDDEEDSIDVLEAVEPFSTCFGKKKKKKKKE